MATTTNMSVKCWHCNAQVSVTNRVTKYRCSECKEVTCFTTTWIMPSDDQSFSSKRWYPRIHKDKTIRTPYLESLNSRPGQGSSRSKKRALLCGVTYNAKKYMLRGTINDVVNMRDFLINGFGYSKEWIRVLTEFEKGQFVPTKANIQKSLKWLVEGSEPGDSLVFYFSGHGLRQPDFNDDELDGFDETICPVDFMEEGMILDNDINADIVRPLKRGVTLHAIVDACHSGTILDLIHIYDHKSGTWRNNRPPSGVGKGTNGGLAISLSACEDDQIAADTSALSGKTMNGAMTYILIQTVKEQPEITYADLLKKMSDAVQKTNKDRCLSSHFLRRIFHHKIIHEPLLSASELFDVKRKKFTL